MSSNSDLIKFICIKQGSRLRVRIISPGYNPNANCQFPRKIRKEGAIYEAPKEALTFSKNSAQKFFYRVKASSIKVIFANDENNDGIIGSNEIQNNTTSIHLEKVYGESGECNICFDNKKDIVFVPCGHFCCCHYCYSQLKEKTCIMCREKINLVATLDQLQ